MGISELTESTGLQSPANGVVRVRRLGGRVARTQKRKTCPRLCDSPQGAKEDSPLFYEPRALC
jgi:hypothetical protein